MDAPSYYSAYYPPVPLFPIRGQQVFIPGKASPEPIESSLEEAISTAPIAELRAMLRVFVSTHADIKEKVSKRLLKPIYGSKSRKRKAFETCRHCDKDYGVAENIEGSCIHHRGKIIPDYNHDLLLDTYEGQLEDGLEDDPEFAEAFQWSCCDRRKNAPGCITTKHTPILSDEERARRAARTACHGEHCLTEQHIATKGSDRGEMGKDERDSLRWTTTTSTDALLRTPGYQNLTFVPYEILR